MPQDSGQGETPIALAAGSVSSSVAGAGAAQSDATLAVGRLGLSARKTLPRPRIALGPVAARIALATLILGAFAVVVSATAGPSVLLPRSTQPSPNGASGPLSTGITYVVAFLPLPIAYWTLKAVTVLLSLGFLALVWHCARKLGRDPRFALAFVAFNPVYLMYEVAGFHNDFFMLVPSMAAIALVLGGRYRSAGATVMVAVAVKFTAVILLPFLLIAARPNRHRVQLLVGAALAAVPLIVLDLALFGLSIPNLSDQSTLLTAFSFPNLFGVLIGIGGGTPGLLKLANVALVLVVAHQIYRRREWLSSAGWSTLALIFSLAWLVPWYVVWLLPLAALGTSVRLRRAAVGLTVFLAVAFAPATGQFLARHNINPLSSSVGQASTSRQDKLAQ